MGQLPVLVINGPTASGKSAVAVRVALRLSALGHPAEIVNTDSMLIYRGMDIGTAKPTPAERSGVTHHLIDILDVTQTASVADFQTRARAEIERSRSAGIIPILAGGSSLYLRAILDVFDFPGTDADIRHRWETELERVGSEALHARLAAMAPDVAAGILPGNGRRVVRALEVIDITGSFRPVLPEWRYAIEGVQHWGLELPRAEMDERIASRVDRMWEAGFVAEVESLVDRGLREGRTSSRALGYRQILAHLGDEVTEEQAKAETISATRRFARKQLGWFRRDHRIVWLPASAPDEAVDTIVSSALSSLDDPD